MKLKKFSILMAALAVVGFSGCKKDSQEGSNAPRNISVTISGLQNQVGRSAQTDPVDIITDNAAGRVTSVDIYVTDASGVILRTGRFSSGTAEWTALTTAGVGHKFINVQSTASKVYVFGNLGMASLASEGANIPTVSLAKTLLEQINMGSLLYIGSDESMVQVQEPIAPSQTIGTTFKAEVELTPIVSRFQINSVELVASGSNTYTKTVGGVVQSATVTWTGFSANLIGVYLNNFYYTNNNRVTGQLMSNTTNGASLITQGKWLFGGTDYSTVAAYNKYNVGSSLYEAMTLPVVANNKCYAFNFFPEDIGSMIPKIHFLLNNMTVTTLTSDKEDVYNPALFKAYPATQVGYVNVVKYFKSPSGTVMTAADFKPNMLYNLDVKISPVVVQEDLQPVQFNVLVTVTVLPWTLQNLTPGFETE